MSAPVSTCENPRGPASASGPIPSVRLPLFGVVAATMMLAPSGVEGQDYYTDIRPLLVQNCLVCHTDESIAWSMEDPEEAYARRHMIAHMIVDRQMPPWIAEAGHQEYHGDPSLDNEAIRLVEAWRQGGFESGEPRPDPAIDAMDHAHHYGADIRADLSVAVLPGESYLPDQSQPDDYRCFVVGWPDDEPGFVTGFRASPGNPRVAHHAVIYAVDPEVADRFHALSDAEERDGYQCFGGALPDRFGQPAVREAYEAEYPDGVRELDRSNFWLAHWAPGMDGHRFPDSTGIRVEPGSALVVQMHYYSQDAPGEVDADTRLDFEIERSVERPAFHLPQTRSAWLTAARNQSMVIPPGSTETYAYTDVLQDIIPYIARVAAVDPERIEALEIHSVNLHMHAFGHSGRVTLRDRNGRVETLLSVPRWDLNWQRDFTFLEPKVFQRGELGQTSLSVECTFRNPGSEPVYGGFGSFDEMCFNFAYIAVRSTPAADEDG